MFCDEEDTEAIVDGRKMDSDGWMTTEVGKPMITKSHLKLSYYLFDLILYVPSTIFQLYQYKVRINVSCARATTQ